MNLLRLYGDCLVKTFRVLGRSAWTLLLPMAYLALLAPIGALLGPLGIVGGLLSSLVFTALTASLLYVVSELVRGAPVRIKEMPQSARHYFWPIMNVAFVFWIASFFVNPLLARAPNGAALQIALYATLFVLFNAVPEVIYQKGEYGGIASIMGSVKFIQEYWIEWLIPNLALGAAFWFGAPALGRLPLAFVIVPVATGALLLACLVFRGYLFQSLDGAGARQRALRQRFGGR
jgi:hypothetical protein